MNANLNNMQPAIDPEIVVFSDEVEGKDRQFVNALADGPVRLHYPGPDVEQDFGVARGGEP